MLLKLSTYKGLLILLFVMLIASCKKDTDNNVDPVDPGEVLVSFEKDVQPIFNNSCVSCHPNSGSMSLLPGESYESLVDFMSPTYLKVRVSPFFADSSVICLKLHGAEGFGFMMPLNGIPLEDEEIKTIEDWIDQGALNN